MTKEQLRKHPEYTKCMEKIKGYWPGFEFTIHYGEILVAKCNALKIVLRDAMEKGLLESRSSLLNLHGETTAETFRRTEVQV